MKRWLLVTCGLLLIIFTAGLVAVWGSTAPSQPSIEEPLQPIEIIKLIAAPEKGHAPLTVAFQVILDNVSNVTKITWDFGDGSLGQSGGATATHIYKDPGLYKATVTVIFDKEMIVSASRIITVTKNNPPLVSLAAVPTSGSVPLTVRFTAIASDPDGDPLKYSWDYGDGSSSGFDSKSSSSPSHIYQNPGTYIARVTVSDGYGGSASASKTITVTVNHLPSLSLIASPTSGIVALTVSFTASVSDPDGDPLSYSWEFGDGSPVQSGGATASHNYRIPGTFSAKVTVSDGKGGSASAQQTITVTPNHPPIVSLTANPTQGDIPLTVNFYAAASDPDGDVLSYRWLFGDGSPWESGGPTASHIYKNPGTYYANVNVDDTRGGGTGRQLTITVTVSPYRMVFSGYDGNIYAMNSDGSSLVRITNSEYGFDYPSWSPDGSKITFTANGYSVGVMNVDGSNLVFLVGGGSIRPTWSPDGSKIAYLSVDDGSEPGLYVMNADGSNQHRVIALNPDDFGTQYAHSLSWSPDGTRIVFSCYNPQYSGFDNIFIVPAAGGQAVWLCEGKYPAWSPDGRQIAFARFIWNGNGAHWEVLMMNSDGTNQRQITSFPGNNEIGSPTWSADGTKIAFEMHGDVVGEGYHIYVMNADGSNVTRLNTMEGLFPCFYGKPR